MSDTLPPSVQFLTTRDTPGPETPGRPLVAKIPGSHPPPGSSAALETIAQSLFSHSPPPSLTYAATGSPSSSGPTAHAKQAPRSRAELPGRQTERGGDAPGPCGSGTTCGPCRSGYGIRSVLRSVSRFLLGPRASGLLLFLIPRALCGSLLLDTLQCVLRTSLGKIPYRPARFLLGDLACFVSRYYFFHSPEIKLDNALGIIDLYWLLAGGYAPTPKGTLGSPTSLETGT